MTGQATEVAGRVPVNPGRVEWSGDNPGIYLKESPDGDWTGLASFFRIALSPHGRGRAMVVLGEPDRAAGYPNTPNLCIADDPELTTYLLAEFLSKFPTFRDRAAPFAVEVTPPQSATGAHDMYSLFMEAGAAEIAVNDQALPGRAVTRPFFGTTMSSAFLAFSETWVAPLREWK